MAYQKPGQCELLLYWRKSPKATNTGCEDIFKPDQMQNHRAWDARCVSGACSVLFVARAESAGTA